MWATRPHLGSIFVKLLHRKTFQFVQCLSENYALRKNGLPRPAKGGSTPAFAYQRAAIAPLPCPNLQPYCFMIQLYLNWTVLKNAIAAGKTCYKNNLLRKCGLLAHTSAAFL